MESLSPFLQDSFIPYFMPVYPGAPELSTGPKTEEGKAVSSRNHTSHGLTYKGVAFFLLAWENAEEYAWLVIDLKREYGPKSVSVRARPS